ncbi:hypothetical protein [Candidatus Thiodictyon syntrophicum]|uniref:Uncharacterized protein n=1 Tax=Candidatus Thiodictyon syntrophicum TaxID=1166950 RepID=A0A2K8U1U7_9GAMM|nr:hypothetical protein [Candidatus Thiodictyon syntrophicum]AUB79544.1 hypothetical protein THSYN_00250 [Candidatus Thiodictyon syntrophicum]
MPGDDQASLTAHPRALDLFTDRLSERRRFAHYLHSRPPEPRPIFFHGDGGTGKSLLLKHLRAQFCRLLPPDEWAHCDGQPDTRVGHQACLDAYRALVGADGSGDSIKVPCIWHDFAATDASEGNPQDAWPALLMLRKQLTKSGFKLPTFDYAVTRWLRATDRLSADQLKQLLPVEELDALGAGVDFLTADQGPILNLLARGLEVVAPDWQGNLQLLLAQRGIDAATRKRLDTLFDTDRDPSALDNALNALPRLFANDLNVWMQRPGAVPRLVLLFDTHEAFWGVTANSPGPGSPILMRTPGCADSSMGSIRSASPTAVSSSSLPAASRRAGPRPSRTRSKPNASTANWSDTGAGPTPATISAGHSLRPTSPTQPRIAALSSSHPPRTSPIPPKTRH